MDLTTTGSFAQSSARQLKTDKNKELGAKDLLKKNEPLKETKPLKPINESTPDYKVELSSPSLPPTPSAPDVSAPKLDNPVKEMAKEKVKEEIKTKVEDTQEIKVKEGSLKKPVVVFVKGLDIFSSPLKSEGGYAGVGRMAESVEGARIYGWNQKNEIVEEIKKTHRDYPVILVGHSLGADTAVEIAQELDSLDHQFRSVDLLITIDAVGFKNDVISQNVKEHLNVFGENDWFFNDGPHVARNNAKTSVENILSPLDHTDIDDQKDVQYEVITRIQNALKKT